MVTWSKLSCSFWWPLYISRLTCVFGFFSEFSWLMELRIIGFGHQSLEDEAVAPRVLVFEGGPRDFFILQKLTNYLKQIKSWLGIICPYYHILMGSITKEHDNLTPLGLRRGLLENVACHTISLKLRVLEGSRGWWKRYWMQKYVTL